MPTSIEDLLGIGLEKMTNPAYVGLIVMSRMQFIGKGGLDGMYEAVSRRSAEVWKRRSFFVNATTRLLTVLFACSAVDFGGGYPIEQAILVGIVALPIAIGQYELAKNLLGALGYKWN